MMIWAPLAKSPNCASHATRASGDSTEYPYSKPTAAYSDSSESCTPKRPTSSPLEMGERDPLLPRAVVDEHGVALAEGPPPGVLARKTHVGALEDDRAEGQGLAEGPVDLAARHHLGPLLELAEQLGVHGEALGHGCGRHGQALELVARHARGHRRAGRGVRGPEPAAPWGAGGALCRVSSSATCSRAWKSSRARSASSTVMSPRRTSDSV